MISLTQFVESKGFVLPHAPAPVGNYVATRCSENFLYVSGQLPLKQGQLLYKGKLGEELTVAEGKKAAELCALNVLSQIEQALEGRQIKSIIKIEGYINACEGFSEHAAVLDGASDLLAGIATDGTGHVRTAIGCSSLPLCAAVELSAIVELVDSDAELTQSMAIGQFGID